MLIYVAVPGHDTLTVRAEPILDSGAEYSVLDGTTAQQLGWRDQDIQQRAEATHPIYGLTTGGRQTVGYVHRLTCLIPLGLRYASLPLRVLITPPHSLSAPVLGRRDFFRHVDFGLVEAEQRCLLRFRDPAVLRDSW